jgi:glycosyltransferase involved in cell wall biosynthesis
LNKEISFGDHYLSKHFVQDKIGIIPKEYLRFIIVIPCFNEPGIIRTLQSILLCNPPDSAVEVIVVVNSPENASHEILATNMRTIREINEWARANNNIWFDCIILDESGLPVHEAGPGLARKIGMDQAVLRFHHLNRPDGIIVSFDADTLCSRTYLREIEKCFKMYPDTRGCSVYFEHSLTGEEFPEIVYRAITEYELHMRYYISAIRETGFPYAYHTIGSCFCVTAETYVNQGGMNKRKAGEDFYFLQKVIPLGNFREINTACVYPSPRPSDRVPFGTGAVIKKYADGKISGIETYNPESFIPLKKLFQDPGIWYGLTSSEVSSLYDKLPAIIREFSGPEFKIRIEEINNNSSSPGTFTKRFYQWFNMFRILKFLNFAHKRHFPKVPVRQAALKFLKDSGYGSFEDMNTVELLKYFRKLQRGEG